MSYAKKKRPAKKIKIDNLDALFSRLVRGLADWTCQRCGHEFPEGRRQGLHCSHFWGRGRWSTRYDLENCDALCHGCHSFLGANPELFRQWKLEKIGEERYEALMFRANQIVKRNNREELLAWIKGELSVLESGFSERNTA